MIFTSLGFLFFFPLVVLLFYVTRRQYRWITLLAASYYFYLNIEPVFGLLTASITLSTYCFTLAINHTKDEARKNLLKNVNIVLILLPLFFFKYFEAVNHGVFHLLDFCHLRWPLPSISLFLPIGISFYTFMAIGYTIDVCNEEIEAEKRLGIVALFISFFPLVLSGPIERANKMFAQFKNPQTLDPQNISSGLKLMLWGYFMKLVVADRLCIYVDSVYGNIEHHTGTTLLLAALLYPIQVYADLGGYSLIAIGASKILGINVMCNFNRPFFATSMAEFWRRWHISLISWLTDYVFKPLSFNLRNLGLWGVVISLMITFLISGIWHGAALTFVAWGLLQGLYLSIEALTNKRRIQLEDKYHLKRNFAYLSSCILLTYLLFSASQIFGRAETLGESVSVFQKILFDHGRLHVDKTTIAYGAIGTFILLASDFREEFFPKRMRLFQNKNILVRFCSYVSIAILILWIGVLNGGQFIYFKY